MPVVLTILGDIFTLEERRADPGIFQRGLGHRFAGRAGAGGVSGQHARLAVGLFRQPAVRRARAIVLCWKYHDHEKPHSTDLDLPGAIVAGDRLHRRCSSLVSGIGPGVVDAGRHCVAGRQRSARRSCFIRARADTAANPIMPPRLMMQRAIGPSMIWQSAAGRRVPQPRHVCAALRPRRARRRRGGGGERGHAGHADLGAERHRRRAAGRALGLPQDRAARLRC